MTWEAFKKADEHELAGPLLALWLERNGEWERAHEVAQEIDGSDGAWVHAFLHRKEGDGVNARYWYRQAGRSAAAGSSEAEWETLVRHFLGEGPG